MKYVRITTVALALIGSIWLALSLLKAQALKATMPKDVVVLSRDVFYPADKSQAPKERATRQRWIRADGAWKEVRTERSPVEGDGRLVVFVSINAPQGRFAHINTRNEVEFDGHFTPIDGRYLSVEFLRSGKDFVREDELLGYAAYVWRSGQSEQSYSEQWYVPEVSFIPIKFVHKNGRGETVTEPITAEFKKVTDADLAVPNLPVVFNKINNDIESLEKVSNKVAADDKRRAIAEFQSKQEEKKKQ